MRRRRRKGNEEAVGEVDCAETVARLLVILL